MWNNNWQEICPQINIVKIQYIDQFYMIELSAVLIVGLSIFFIEYKWGF